MTKYGTYNGVDCDGCKKKVQKKNIQLLKDLPNVLICHLTRFDFNPNTFETEKMNSKLEFPHRLDLEPYTSEGVEWREQKTELEK